MRIAWLTIVLAGCMTDPNGDSCAWTPGNDGFCPSDSGSSGNRDKVTTYISPTGVSLSDHVRVAMTRTETGGSPQIESAAVVPGLEPRVVPVLLDGEAPIANSIVPQLAAIDESVYIAWIDINRTAAGAPLGPGGTVRAEDVIDLGSRHGWLRRVGQRYLFVRARDADRVVRGVWIGLDGRSEGTTELVAELASDGALLDVSEGTASVIALAYLVKREDLTSELRVARIAADGTRLDGEGIPIPISGSVITAQVVVTERGELLGVVRTTTAVSFVRITDRVHVSPIALPAITELVRGPGGILALTVYEGRMPTKEGRMLDETGNVIAGPFGLGAGGAGDAIATPDGFALVHATEDAAVALTPLDGAYPGEPVEIAYTTVDGCGCRTADGHTAGLVLCVLVLVLRRRPRYPARP